MGLMEERVAKELSQKIGDDLAKRFVQEFAKIEKEFTKMAGYINELEARIDVLESNAQNTQANESKKSG